MEEGLPSNPELKCSTMFGILYHGVSAGSGKLEAADGSQNRYAGQEGSCRCQAKKSEREAEGIGMYLSQLLKISFQKPFVNIFLLFNSEKKRIKH